MARQNLFFSRTAATFIVIAITLSLGGITSAYAGSTENARRLIDLLDVPATLEETIVGSVDQARTELLAKGMPASTVNLVSQTLKSEMLASMPDLLDEITDIYADQFTDEELGDLIAFYETPTGRKYVKSQNDISRQQGSALQNWLDGVRERTRERITGASA